jgi:hypothetical protein
LKTTTIAASAEAIPDGGARGECCG